MSHDKACVRCVAWERLAPNVLGPQHARKGRCRKDPPDYNGRWPLTEEYDWCLEFEPSSGERETA